MNIFSRKIILASKSPRRRYLLAEAGFNFEVKTKEVEENFPADMDVTNVAAFLAQKKANAARSFLQNDEIILAADSVVIHNNTIFGKPKDADDARQTLQQLSGNMHQVITGVCLLSSIEERVFSGCSNVYFNPIDSTEIDYYIEQHNPYDKAGSYGIQEWIGLCKIAKIEGSYSNIVGLPMELVYQELQKMVS